MLPKHKKLRVAIYPRLSPPRPSRCCRCCGCCHGARTVIMPLDLLPRGCFLPRCSTAAISTRYPRARSLRHYTLRSRVHAAIMPRDFPPPNNPPGRVHAAGGRAAYRECADMFPLVSDYPHICFLLDLLPHLLLMLLVLSRNAHGHAVRLKIPVPLRTARVPTILLPTRGFSCCCTSQLPQGHYPPCVQLRLSLIHI